MSRRFQNFAARLEAAADPEDVPENPEDDTPEKPETPDDPPADEPDSPPEKESTAMADDTPVEQTDGYKAGMTAGRKLEADRMNAVFASDHFAGREARAAQYLRTSMSAEEITALLATDPKAATLSEEQQVAAAEEGGRKEMREAMAANGNADLGGDGASPAALSPAARIIAAQRKATGRTAATKE